MKICKCENTFTLECLESDLMNLRGILELLYGYFRYDRDYIKENPIAAAVQYSQYGALNSVCIDAVDKMLDRVRE